MTDGEILDTVKQIRELCTRLSNSVANHSEAHPEHSITDCTEGVARLSAGFAHIAYHASHVVMENSTDLAETVRDLIYELGEATNGDNDE